ncbi:hypothetical protein BDK51DRAFT_27755 [Blyttiomyces helicus]|uniref:Uncharacterized protein n=1 Tax=Blyttiomyces helicus TaxID=388810 RepID=A0A4P9WSZ0_9FUNG|nr:hypothetical protein BDK51DRAFT_27755 [Blyttiomyces helicus]|eukprot:RKO94156.1 hypothetical protein BDK51DRAFT_27755 [Blyttiomyces helicus]
MRKVEKTKCVTELLKMSNRDILKAIVRAVLCTEDVINRQKAASEYLPLMPEEEESELGGGESELREDESELREEELQLGEGESEVGEEEPGLGEEESELGGM